jgi:amidase
LKPGALLGVLHGPFGFHPRMEAVLDDTVAALKAAGAEVVDLDDFPNPGQVSEPELEVLLYELKDGLNAYLATLGPDTPVKSLKEVIAFDEAHRAEECPFFKQELFIRAEKKGPLTEPAYLAAREACLKSPVPKASMR